MSTKENNMPRKYNLIQTLVGVIVGAVFVVVAMFAITNLYAGVAIAAVDSTTTTEGDAGGFVLCGNTAGAPCTISHLFAAFVVIINYLIAMAGFVAVAAIIFAGFMMIYSQGQEQLKTAKGRFSGAIIGLVLVAAAYILINSLFAGRFSIGVCEGESILTSPLTYIQSQGCEKANSTSTAPGTTNPNTNSTTNSTTNTNASPTTKTKTIPKPGK